MPAPNDLTPEEEAAFTQHGVQPAGPGSEPVVENDGDVQDQGAAVPVVEANPPTVVTPPEGGRPRNADGTFMSAEQIAAQQTANPAAANDEHQQPRMVPHEALHAERQRAANAIRQSQLLQTRMNAMLTARQQQEAPQLPDINDDPAGYIQGLEARLSAFENQRREEAQTRQIDDALSQDEVLFSQSVPDYDQASDHYVQSRARELLQFYSPDEAHKILTDEARQIANQAWQRGVSAAQMVYNLAQARGYTPGNTAANPQLAPIPARPGPTPQAQVQAINAGQAASRSLSGGGGGAAPAGQLNAEAVLNMSEEEFEQYLGIGKKGANARFAAIG